MCIRILFSEGSSLTAREFLSVLGPAGHHIEVLDSNPACLCRFSRWTRRIHLCPPAAIDPLGYLDAVNATWSRGRFDVLLPTHEQAWLFAEAGSRLRPADRVAVARPEAFSRVQSKIEFAILLDELGLPQPAWRRVNSVAELAAFQPPYYLKAPFSTAGAGVRRVTDSRQAPDMFRALRSSSRGAALMIQAQARGEYAQVQALFDHGRLVAAHESVQTAVGMGSSAAGRVSVSHPFARQEVAQIGQALAWHGGLTLDYIFSEEAHYYIECNPRTVEPANAAASGVELPSLQLELSLGRHPEQVPAGRAGVRTHSALAVLIGAADRGRTRRAVLAAARDLALRRGPFRCSRERLTPVAEDLPSAAPLVSVFGRLILDPASAQDLARQAIAAYSITEDAIVKLESQE